MSSTLLMIAQVTVGEGGMSRGIAIAVAGIVIVFTALLLITLFIEALPRVLAVVARVWPEVEDAHSRQGHLESHPESQIPDDGAVLAAIGFVLHTEMQRQLALEKTTAEKK